MLPGFQISMHKWHIFNNISLYIYQILSRYHSLELSTKDDSNEWLIDKVWWRNMDSYISNLHIIWGPVLPVLYGQLVVANTLLVSQSTVSRRCEHLGRFLDHLSLNNICWDHVQTQFFCHLTSHNCIATELKTCLPVKVSLQDNKICFLSGI